MKYIKKFEEMNLDKYRNFLDKYQKSGYISISSIKKLKEWGLDIKDFSHVENQVVKSLEFFRSGDKELFFDYFMDIKDKYPYLSTYFYYSLDVYPKSAAKWSTKLDKFNIIVSMDDKNLPSLDFVNVDTNVSVIDKIISGIEDSRQKEIENRKEQMDSFKKRRPGADDHWAKDYMLRAKSENFIENCTISPIINLKIFLNDDDHYYNLGEDEWQSYDKYLKELRKTVVEDIEVGLNDVLKSYFYAIGYHNITFKVEKKGYGRYGFYDPSSDIVIFNIQCELN